MQITYNIQVKRTTTLSAAEAYAIQNLARPQASEFLRAARRGMPDDEVESVINAIKGPLAKPTKGK